MIKAKVIEKFSLKDFDLLTNVERADKSKNKKGFLYEGDTFNCNKTMADYLTGNNPLKRKVVELIEVKEEEKTTKNKKKKKA